MTEEILGLPRRKDLKLVVLDVGESVPASSILRIDLRTTALKEQVQETTYLEPPRKRVGQLHGSTSSMAGWRLRDEVRT